MAEKMTPKGLVVGLIVDQKKTKKVKPDAKGKETKQNESSVQDDSSEQAEKTEE